MRPTPLLPVRLWRARTSYLMLLPTFALLLVFNYYPALRGLLYAFQKVSPGISSEWVGLTNFRRMTEDYILLQSIGNMLILVAGNLAKSIVLPLLIAKLIASVLNARHRYLFQTLFLFPIVVPGMVGIMLWKGFIYDANVGLINQTLGALGFERAARTVWLDHTHALGAIIFTGFPWVGGIGFLIFLAGLLSIPISLTEAARIDGATWMSIFRRVELPLIIGQIKLVVILTFIGTMQDFGQILVMTQGGPGTSTHVPALHMYYMGFRFDHFGYAAAIGLVLFVVVLGATILNMRFIRSGTEY